MSTNFPTLIDSTMRAAFIDCPQKFYWLWIRRLSPIEKSIHLHAGGAFAAALEQLRNDYFFHGVEWDDAVLNGMLKLMEFWGDYQTDWDEPKSLQNTILAYDSYCQEYRPPFDTLVPYEIMGKATVEVSFSFPIPNTRHPETGDPILYAGRLDMIGKYNGQPWAVDEKTTTQLGASWGKKWDMRGQFLGYEIGVEMTSGVALAGTIVRGTSFLKNRNEHKEIYLPAQRWKQELFLEQLSRDTNKMIQHFESGIFDRAFGEACERYSGCPSKELCDSKNPEIWVSQYFTKNEWNPLHKNPED